jgi:hypothetical protein
MPLQLSGTSGVLDNSGAFIAGTAVASTSGTSIDFTSIPSWVKRVTVMFNGVSTNSTSNYQIQIGSGSVTTSGYLTTSTYASSAVATATFTTGFGLANPSGASTVFQGSVILTLLGSNTWVAMGVIGESDVARTWIVGGSSPALSGALDRVRITTVNGTDTFDAGSINILYE